MFEHTIRLANTGRSANVDAQLRRFDGGLLELDHGTHRSANLHSVAGGGDGGSGQRKAEGRAISEFAFDGNLPSERFHKSAHKSQPEARPGIRAAGEASENGAEPLGFDAASIVAHEELDAILNLGGLKNNGSTFRSVAKGIHHEIVENTPHGPAIGVDVGQVCERL